MFRPAFGCTQHPKAGQNTQQMCQCNIVILQSNSIPFDPIFGLNTVTLVINFWSSTFYFTCHSHVPISSHFRSLQFIIFWSLNLTLVFFCHHFMITFNQSFQCVNQLGHNNISCCYSEAS